MSYLGYLAYTLIRAKRRLPGVRQITKGRHFLARLRMNHPVCLCLLLAGTQLQVVKNWQLTVAYQGSRSRKLVRTIDL